MTVRIAAQRCATCIFRPVDGGRTPLTAAVVAGLVRNADANDAASICHERYDDPAVCRGFYDVPRPPERVRRALESGSVELVGPPDACPP